MRALPLYDGATQVLQVDTQTPAVEHSLAQLQAQIERLGFVVQEWKDAQHRLGPAERQLQELTDNAAAIVDRWNETDRRHTRIVAELENRLAEWHAIESRLEQNSSHRLKELERSIEHEWQALRYVHEEPVKQLREQAATLGETCVAAANLALRSFDRAEARFAALEADLQQRMAQLSADVHAVLIELRATAARRPALPGDVSPFPLESVLKIHDELRDGDDPSHASATHAESAGAPLPAVARQLPENATAFSERLETLERAITTEHAEVRVNTTRSERLYRNARVALVVLSIVATAALVLGFQARRQAQEARDDASVRVAAAQQQAAASADQRVASARHDADRQIADARSAAAQAQIVSGVLAAPDLIRYNLAGTAAAPRADGQVLLSRSRGIVFSGSRLSPPRTGGTYQLWVFTIEGPVGAGTFAPDESGRASFAVDNPPAIPRPITGMAVTSEPAGGSKTPTGVVVLARERQ
jgi:type II secretory pathway pseudopilin PulG